MSKTIVVVGASRGIGLGVMKYLSEYADCHTFVGVVRKSEDASNLSRMFADNKKVYIYQGDVVDQASMHNVAARMSDSNIVPDIVLCNAGVLTEPVSLEKVSDEDMSFSFQVNVLGPLHVMKAFSPSMRTRPGAVIVNVSSGWGLRGDVGQSTYCATKHALEGLMKCAAMEAENDPVSIVTVRPGMVVTDMLAKAVGSATLAAEQGVKVADFVPQFCHRLFRINKSHSGTHLDCGVGRALF